MILLLLIVLMVAILGYFFFAPFYLEINSFTGLFRIRFHWLASALLFLKEDTLLLELNIAGWKKNIDLLMPKKTGEKIPTAQNVSKSKPIKKRRTLKFSLKKINSVRRSFKINAFYLSIDTGNIQANGLLYPLAYAFARYSNKNISINFREENEIILEVENSLARMSRAYIFS